VGCFTNCNEVELLLNGVSQGKRKVEKNSHAEWDVKYEPGSLKAIGIRNGKTLVTTIETTGVPFRLVATPDRETIDADGEDVCVVNIVALDEKGREVSFADNLVKFEIAGDAKIIGVGNGNPGSHEADKILQGNYYRKLFNGKCQVILQAGRQPGIIELRAHSERLKSSVIQIKSSKTHYRPYVN